jgi:UDP-glucose 4-epimerase
MIAVVTGSTGFIGSHLVEALRARGAEVRVLRRAEYADAAIVRNSPVWNDATHCFHLGAATKGRSRDEFMRSNVDPTRHLAETIAARGATGPRLVFLSSQAAAGPSRSATHSVCEDDACAPVEAYGESKLAAERLIQAMGGRLRATIVRACAVYGPGDRDFLQVFRQATGRVAVYAAPADQQFSIVHVRDLVSAIIAAGENPAAAGRTYFVANPAPTTWRAMYAAIAHGAGQGPTVELQIPAALLAAAAFVSDLLPINRDAAPLLNRHKVTLARANWWLCDATRARRELGWSPTIAFDAGIRETLAWYLAAGWLRGGAAPGMAVA